MSSGISSMVAPRAIYLCYLLVLGPFAGLSLKGRSCGLVCGNESVNAIMRSFQLIWANLIIYFELC